MRLKKQFALLAVIIAVLVIAAFVLILSRHELSLTTDLEWAIGVYSGDSPYHLSPSAAASNPVITRADIVDVNASFVADPFVLRRDSVWYMFYEVFDSLAGRGVIGLSQSGDGLNWEYKGIVLREPFHLSYPYVFKSGGVFYMIPESAEAKSVADTLLHLAPGFGPGVELVLCIQMVAGDLNSALRTYAEAGSPLNSRGGFLLHVAGRKAESRRVLQETVAKARRFVEAGDETATPRFEAAAAMELLGERAEALAWFRKAVESGWREVRWARRDPLLESQRADPAFRELLDDVTRRVEAERLALRNAMKPVT